MADRWRRPGRIAFGLALSALGAAAMPAACLYPDDFTFDEPSGGGGGDATASSGGGNNPVTTSSSGSGGMGGGSTSSSSSSSGGGGMTGGEDCLNGLDDDGDAMLDCADPDCDPAVMCVPSVPFGWSGFAALFEGVAGQEPACPSAFPSPDPYVGHHTPIAGNATCSACSCDPAAGQTCNLPLEIIIKAKVCGEMASPSGTLEMPVGWNGSCHGPDGYGGGQVQCGGPCNVSVSSAAPTVTGGSCAAKGGQSTVPPLSWAILGKACGGSAIGAGCGAGNVCQPKPPLPFISGVCIYKSGDVMCPGDPFTQKHVFYGNAVDTRACTACQCGGVVGGSCAVEMSVYSDALFSTCTTGIATFNAGGCANLNGNPSVYGRKATITQAPSGGTCPPSGGQPTGSVAPSDPTTFCCVP